MALRTIVNMIGISPSQKNFDKLELHFWIFLASFIPSINIFISLPSVEIVFIRMFIASILLGGIIYWRRLAFKVPRKTLVELLVAGVFTSIYWIFFVIAAKIGNASVALVGVATSPLWVSILSPLFGGSKLSFNEVMMGLNAIFGVYMIFSSSFAYSEGMIMAIAAAFFAALVTIIGSRHSSKYDHRVVTFYQMIGGWIGTIAVFPIFFYYIDEGSLTLKIPTSTDWLLIFTLAIIFSIFAFSAMIKVMKSLSPFTVSLANNLSPIYGGVAALLLFGEQEIMDVYFYAGAMIIIASLVAPTLAKALFQQKIQRKKPEKVYD
ncbi:DMT family transporter [Limibacter armeniacum]|uniref:DMT family transporter n=1 Tax=Limibacter armeniacum TaxID=466084 RepID=UPI002FE685C9